MSIDSLYVRDGSSSQSESLERLSLELLSQLIRDYLAVLSDHGRVRPLSLFVIAAFIAVLRIFFFLAFFYYWH